MTRPYSTQPTSGGNRLKHGTLREDVLALTANGTRRVGTDGHAQASAYIVERLAGLRLVPYATDYFVLPYGPEELGFGNIVAQLPGQQPELAPLLLGAHFDTCADAPGADDNAAAVAILLAVAEQLSHQPLNRPVVFGFFDAEEPPHFLQTTMGSIRFYEDHLTGPVHTAIILDLVGHDVPIRGMEDLLFVTGAESDPEWGGTLLYSEPETGLRTVPTLNDYVGDLSDHHVFRRNKTPYLLLTCGRWEHYHAATDTSDRLNFDKMDAVSDYVEVLANRVSACNLSGPFNSADTLETELHFLKKNVLPALRNHGLDIRLETREDITKLVDLLMSRFEL
jgi:hypothetical protein